MKRLRGGSGLGDSIYLRPLAEHFISKGQPIEVCSDYPDIFIGSQAKVAPFSRENIDIVGHYVNGKTTVGTNQWQDICHNAHAPEDLPLRFPWREPAGLREEWRTLTGGMPMILVHGGRAPMARKDGFGAELLPERGPFVAALDAISRDCCLVRIGGEEKAYDLPCDMDMRGRTSVAGLLDLAWICDGIIAQPSFCIPMAECFDKPLLCVWASSGMHCARHPYLRAITPWKVLSKRTSHWFIDDQEFPEEHGANWFAEQIRKTA
jgi:hypothetical protein